jgi:CBS domain-containing protein
MTRDVKTCTEDDTIEGLMGRMTTGKFRHMPVVEQEKLIGIVSRSATRLHPPVVS